MPKRGPKKSAITLLSQAKFKNLFANQYTKWITTEAQLRASEGNPASVEEANEMLDKAIQSIAKEIASAVPGEVARVVDDEREDIITDMTENLTVGPALPQMGPSAPTAPAWPSPQPQQQEVPMPQQRQQVPGASRLKKVLGQLEYEKPKMKKEELPILQISYPAELWDTSLENELEDMLSDFGASIGGSGMGFGERDISIYDVTPDAERAVKKFFKRKGIPLDTFEYRAVEVEDEFGDIVDEVDKFYPGDRWRKGKKAPMTKKLASAFAKKADDDLEWAENEAVDFIINDEGLYNAATNALRYSDSINELAMNLRMEFDDILTELVGEEIDWWDVADYFMKYPETLDFDEDESNKDFEEDNEDLDSVTHEELVDDVMDLLFTKK